MLSTIWRYFSADYLVPAAKRKGAFPTDRKAYTHTLNIALPSIAEMVLMSLIGSVDTVMVGQLGKNALAAVSLPGQPRMIMLAVFFALNVGVTAIVARRRGENRPDAASETLRNALMLVLGFSLVIMALVLLFSEALIRFSGGNERTAEDAIVLKNAMAYFRIMAMALPINAIGMCVNAALRGVGNTKITMRVNMVSNLTNVLFNYLLISGNLGFPRLQVRGAAIASVIGMTAGTVLSLLTVIRGNSYLHLNIRGPWRIDRETLSGILKIGGNAMLEQVSMRIGFFIYSRIIYGLGVTMYAAHNIAMQFLNLTYCFADGTGIAGTSLVGQYLGAKREDLSLLYGRVCQRIAFIISTAIGIFIVLLRYPISSLFIDINTPDADIVIQAAADTMLIVALIQPFQMGSVVLSGCLRGAGDNLFVAMVMGICVSLLRPALTYLAVHILRAGLPLAWLISLSEIAIRFTLFAWRFQGDEWKSKRV